jgi:hypothetical protein
MWVNDGVNIFWQEPDGNGAKVTSYTMEIRQANGEYSIDSTNCDASKEPVFSARYCRIPVAFLKAAPYSLPWGSSVFARLTATNIKGTSAFSTPGNGAVIIYKPDAPTNLLEDVSGRTESTLLIKWTPPIEDGGTRIIDYRIRRAIEGGEFEVLAATQATSFLVVSLTVGINYQFEVQARNAYDYGPYSEQLSLLCATVPLAPEDP